MDRLSKASIRVKRIMGESGVVKNKKGQKIEGFYIRMDPFNWEQSYIDAAEKMQAYIEHNDIQPVAMTNWMPVMIDANLMKTQSTQLESAIRICEKFSVPLVVTSVGEIASSLKQLVEVYQRIDIVVLDEMIDTRTEEGMAIVKAWQHAVKMEEAVCRKRMHRARTKARMDKEEPKGIKELQWDKYWKSRGVWRPRSQEGKSRYNKLKRKKKRTKKRARKSLPLLRRLPEDIDGIPCIRCLSNRTEIYMDKVTGAHRKCNRCGADIIGIVDRAIRKERGL